MLKVICKMAKPTESQSSQLAHYPPFAQFPSLSLLPLPSGCTFCNSRVKADMASLPPSTVASRRRARGARFASPWRGLKKHQPCRARHVRRAGGSLRSRIYRRSQTVCFSRPAKGFHLFDVAWRDLQPTSKDRCHPCACCTVCLRRHHGHHSQGPLNGASSAKISHARKRAAAVVAATVEVAKAPPHAQHNHRDPSFFRQKLYM